MRRLFRFYGNALASETSPRFGALMGVLWVLSAGFTAVVSGSDAGVSVRLPYYEVAATIIPVLLLAYFIEQGAMTSSIARNNRLLEAKVAQGEEMNNPELLQTGKHLILTGRALAAQVAGSAAMGEALALTAVANGRSTPFLFVGATTALAIAGISILMFAVARIGQP